MEDFEYGACFSIWLNRTLTTYEKSLLKEYEIYLMRIKNKRYSFMHEFKVPFITNYEKSQLLKTIGYVPEEEIYICGLATPLLRSMEAILKHFGGYAQIGAGDDPTVEGESYEIRKTNIYFPHRRYNKYYLSDWRIIASFYNRYDPLEIKKIYSILDFQKNKYFGSETKKKTSLN
jgi:hypothetical protein